jgi:hypothetical protein
MITWYGLLVADDELLLELVFQIDTASCFSDARQLFGVSTQLQFLCSGTKALLDLTRKEGRVSSHKKYRYPCAVLKTRTPPAT